MENIPQCHFIIGPQMGITQWDDWQCDNRIHDKNGDITIKIFLFNKEEHREANNKYDTNGPEISE
jgi:hypothetical protein